MGAAAFDRDLYMRAWRFAAERHQGQLVPGTALPYVVHVGAVAMEVIATLAVEPSTDPDLAVGCALLHDTVEDTATTPAELEDHFGAGIARGVVALSKNARLAKADQMRDSLARILTQPREVAMVKLADRAVNLEPPPAHWDLAKRRTYHEQAGLILDTLGAASATLAARLRAKRARYEAHLEAPAPSAG